MPGSFGQDLGAERRELCLVVGVVGQSLTSRKINIRKTMALGSACFDPPRRDLSDTRLNPKRRIYPRCRRIRWYANQAPGQPFSGVLRSERNKLLLVAQVLRIVGIYYGLEPAKESPSGPTETHIAWAYVPSQRFGGCWVRVAESPLRFLFPCGYHGC